MFSYISRGQFALFEREEDSPDIPSYIIRPYAGKKGSSLAISEYTYTIRVPQEGKCWNCKEGKNSPHNHHAENFSLFKCDICRCVQYCSKACQKEDWPRHRKVCRKASFYDLTKCAIILVTKDILSEQEKRCATQTAYELVDQKHIHPNHILVDTHMGGGRNLYRCNGFFEIDSLDLMAFLERGLSSQEVIRNDYFITLNEANIQILLEYGGQDLYFPHQYEAHMLRYLVSKGCDPDEIFDPTYTPDESTALFLASIGYTFSQMGTFRQSLLTRLEIYPYIGKVKMVMQFRIETIKAELSEHLIPVLAQMVVAYL